MARRRLTLAVLGLTIGAGLTVPVRAHAATTASSTDTLTLSAGTLSISGLGTASLSAAASAGTVSGGLNSGTWSDATGTGLGWNGTIALESFIYQGTWTWASGTTALTSTASGAYTGTAGQASIQLTVTGTPTAASTPYSYTLTENGTTSSGSGTATNGSAATITKGMQITFNAATTYTVGAVYDVEMGVLPTTALTLDTAAGSVSAGVNPPTLINNGSTVSSSSATAYGTAVKFVQAQALNGLGNWTVVPGATITWTSSQVWAAAYVANAQYTIASGP